MHSKSNNTKFTFYIDGNEVVDEVFDSPRSKYQDNLETSVRAKINAVLIDEPGIDESYP